MTEGRYRIKVRGQLGSSWTDWFDGWAITLDKSGNTLLSKEVADQAALHGVLAKIRNLNLSLISVCYIDSEGQ